MLEPALYVLSWQPLLIVLALFHRLYKLGNHSFDRYKLDSLMIDILFDPFQKTVAAGSTRKKKHNELNDTVCPSILIVWK